MKDGQARNSKEIKKKVIIIKIEKKSVYFINETNNMWVMLCHLFKCYVYHIIILLCFIYL